MSPRRQIIGAVPTQCTRPKTVNLRQDHTSRQTKSRDALRRKRPRYKSVNCGFPMTYYFSFGQREIYNKCYHANIFPDVPACTFNQSDSNPCKNQRGHSDAVEGVRIFCNRKCCANLLNSINREETRSNRTPETDNCANEGLGPPIRHGASKRLSGERHVRSVRFGWRWFRVL